MQWLEASAAQPASAARAAGGGGYYGALMGPPFEGQHKKEAYMFVSDNPVREVYVHNHQLVKNKDTRAVAPHWQLRVVVGPFAALDSALAFGRVWVHNTRGAPSKYRRGIALARAQGLRYFIKPARARTRAKTLGFLRKHAPAAFVETLEDY